MMSRKMRALCGIYPGEPGGIRAAYLSGDRSPAVDPEAARSGSG